MSKTPLQWSKALIAMLLTILSLSANAEKRCIYYFGAYNDYPAPMEANASAYEDFKIYETEEGSNVYEGIIYNHSTWGGQINYFRFYSELMPLDVEYSVGCWARNNIHPTRDAQLLYENGQYTCPDAIMTDEVVFDDVVNVKIYGDYGVGCWRQLTYGKPVKYIVDLNNNTMTAILDMDVWITGDEKPVLEKASLYPRVDTNPKIFMPKGECRFALYNFFSDKLYPGTSTDYELTSPNAYITSAGEGEGYYTIPNWGGGTISLSSGAYLAINNLYQNLNNKNPFATWPDEAYIVGEFCWWTPDAATEMTKVGDHFEAQVSNPGEFKIIGQRFWGDYDAGISGMTDVNGATIFYVSEFRGLNFTLPEGDWKIAFDPSRAAVWMWPAELDADPEPEGFFKDATTPTPPDIKPFTGLVMVTPNDFVDLRAIRPSEIDIYHEFPVFDVYPSDSNFSFTVNIEKEQQFAFLMFDNDNLVKVIDPVADTNLVFSGTSANTRVTSDVTSELHYWTATHGGNMQIKINTEVSDMTGFDAEILDLGKYDCIYLIGMAAGWEAPDESNESSLEAWRLFKTTSGQYYGQFEIPAGEAIFRFYTSLNGWEVDSWGIIEEDYAIECDWTVINEIRPGKGSYNFLDWPGGTMYILVDLNRGRIETSSYPMYVEIAEPEREIEIDDTLFNIDEGYSLIDQGNGIYTSQIVCWNSDYTLRLLRTKQAFSSTEPEWSRSYTLTFDEDELEFDEGGVAEVKFTFNDGVDIAEPSALVLPAKSQSIDGFGHSYFVTVDFNTSTIYVDRSGAYYLAGTLTDNEEPSYANRHRFQSARIDTSSGTLIDLPAGNLTLKANRLFKGESQMDIVAEASVDESGIYRTALTESTIYVPNGLTVANYPGGLSYFGYYNLLAEAQSWDGSNYIGSFSNLMLAPVNLVNSFDAVVFSGYDVNTDKPMYRSVGHLDRIDVNSLTFKGTVELAPDEYNKSCNFGLAPNIDPTIFFGGTLKSVALVDGQADYEVNSQWVNLSNLAEGKIELTLSLDNMSGHIKFIDGVKATGYTLHADPANLSGEFPSADVDGNPMLKTKFSNLPTDTFKLNFSTTDSEILAPDADLEVVEFDEHGRAVLPFVVTKFEGEAAQAAAKAPKWTFKTYNCNLDVASYTYIETSDIIFEINREEGTVSFTYSEAMNTIYAVQNDHSGEITNFDDVKNGSLNGSGEAVKAMTRSADNVYHTSIVIGTDAELCLVSSITDGTYVTADGRFYGVAPLDNNDLTIEFADGDEKAIRVLPFTTSTTGFKIVGNPGADVDITYKPDERMLYLTMAVTGVEAIEADSNANAPMEYYNLQGVRVANPAGGIFIRRQGTHTEKVLIK